MWYWVKYQNGATHIQLMTMDHEPMATATVNVPGFAPDPEFVLIKDHAENEGILDALMLADIIDPIQGGEIPVGFAEAHLCKLLIKE